MHIYRNFVVIVVLDLILLVAAIQISYLLRLDFRFIPIYQTNLMKILPLFLLTKVFVFQFFDLYKGMWRFTGVRDLINVIKAATISSLIIFTGILLATRFIGFPRSAFVIDWCLTIFFIGGLRLFVRFFFEILEDSNQDIALGKRLKNLFSHRRKNQRRLLIIGAGNCGETIHREIRNNGYLKYQIVGFLDDHATKQGKKIHGAPVLGSIDQVELFTKKLAVDEILIAIPSARGAQMRRIVDLCKKSAVPFKTIPGYKELIDGRVSLRAIREVAYRDLLGREVVKLDEKRIGNDIAGNVVLVTGAAGSIGSELCRQICRFNPAKLVLFERAESPLYELDLELKRHFRFTKIQPILGDILDEPLLSAAFDQHQPAVVFHAAAYKHVPMLELQPWRAVTNNIVGTRNVVEAADHHGVERFVFVSTDKAVRPVNVMGASKRVAEMLVQCRKNTADSGPRFMTVRFGNVVGSVGSVVPLFQRQIAQGGPVTVTHPEATRFFMTIPEASQLILQAGAMGKGGEIFILDMGTAIRIEDMARDLIRLSGFEPDVDIPIEYVGLRPGEKLYEELITVGEDIVPTPHEKILVIQGAACNLGELNRQIGRLSELARDQDAEGIRALLNQIVPEYAPNGHTTPKAAAAGAAAKVVPFPKTSSVA
ncbi:MAG: nucleoside-diphosphate sugar epimerase/dehydratase [Desulfobacteraceae bacterium]|jgi:FlaA1/EpsC-like NDP-sugar epimerase